MARHRSVTPIISRIRDICRRKSVIECLRYADNIATRVQPHPHVPGGPYHKTSKVYYFTRDARRLVEPPLEIYSAGKQLELGKSAPDQQQIKS